MSIKDGGPAFPQREQVGDVVLDKGGMSLRDYFAAKAMQGIIANPHGKGGRWDDAAQDAYAAADAMLRAREAV